MEVKVFPGTLPDPKKRATHTGQACPVWVCVWPEAKSRAGRNLGLGPVWGEWWSVRKTRNFQEQG